MLAVIAHQVDARYPRTLTREIGNYFPAPVAAAVVHQHGFIWYPEGGKRHLQPVDQGQQTSFAVIHGNDNGKRTHTTDRASLHGPARQAPGFSRFRAAHFSINLPSE